MTRRATPRWGLPVIVLASVLPALLPRVAAVYQDAPYDWVNQLAGLLRPPRPEQAFGPGSAAPTLNLTEGSSGLFEVVLASAGKCSLLLKSASAPNGVPQLFVGGYSACAAARAKVGVNDSTLCPAVCIETSAPLAITQLVVTLTSASVSTWDVYAVSSFVYSSSCGGPLLNQAPNAASDSLSVPCQRSAWFVASPASWADAAWPSRCGRAAASAASPFALLNPSLAAPCAGIDFEDDAWNAPPASSGGGCRSSMQRCFWRARSQYQRRPLCRPLLQRRYR